MALNIESLGNLVTDDSHTTLGKRCNYLGNYNKDALENLTFGQKITYLRKLRGFQERKAFLEVFDDVSYSYLWQMETDIITNIPDRLLEKLAEILHVPAEILK